MEFWGGENTEEEKAVLDKLDAVVAELMELGHHKVVKVEGYIIQAVGTSEEYDGRLTTSVNLRGQTLAVGRELVDDMVSRMARLEAGEKV